MPRFRRATYLDVPRERVWDWHARAGALQRLLPPWQDVRLVSRDPRLENGSRATLELGLGPVRKRWVAVHRDVVPGEGFVDEQETGPFESWRHEHRFDAADGGGTMLVDEVEYELPLGSLGSAIAGAYTESSLERTFSWRHERTARDLARQARLNPAGHDGGEPRVAISGASGLVGTDLSAFLGTAGYRVHSLVRRKPREGSDEIEWRPGEGRIDAAALEGVDAVIHLAGESLLGRWSEEKKRRIRSSRVEGTDVIARTLASLDRPPRVLVSASAIGFYGDRGDELLDEDSAAGEGFLAGVCADWEAATAPAEEAGVRVAHLRTGVALSPRGGALKTVLPIFRVGLGGPLGDGTGWMSWIGLDDLVGAIAHIMRDETLRGPVNAVAPSPVTTREYAREIGRVLRRPAVLSVPEFALRCVAGEVADEMLLASTRVRPARLEASGFSFLTPDLPAALRWELGL